MEANSESRPTEVSGAQRQLFPLDPWGAESAFAVIDWPCPGIKRATVGPLCLGDYDQPEESLKCLAVAEDGMFLACMRVTRRQLTNSTAAWEQVALGLDVARQYPVSVATLTDTDVPPDCMECWSSLAFWVPHPRRWNPVPGPLRSMSRLLQNHQEDRDQAPPKTDAREVLGQQIASTVSEVFRAVHPRLREALTMRPKMSVSMAHRLLALAETHGVNSRRYALQALNTEPLGLLHLAASGHPASESSRVRDAIFSGASLPDALAQLGVAKAIHRRNLKENSRRAWQAPSNEPSLSEHLIAGRDWLRAMRLAGGVRLQAQQDWKEFLSLERKISILNLQCAETTSRILQWCMRSRYQSKHRFELVAQYALSISKLASELAGIDVIHDDAFGLALELVQRQAPQTFLDDDQPEILDSHKQWQLLTAVSTLSGQTVTQLLRMMFDAHPGIPAGLCMPESLTIFPLNSVELAETHGAACDVCFQQPELVIYYFTRGRSLYGVRSAGTAVGTIALMLDKTEERPRVHLLEVSGANNSDPNADLQSLACSLADSWVDESQLEQWETYTYQCAQWAETVTNAAVTGWR